jgi:hypothetical protein
VPVLPVGESSGEDQYSPDQAIPENKLTRADLTSDERLRAQSLRAFAHTSMRQTLLASLLLRYHEVLPVSSEVIASQRDRLRNPFPFT